MAFCEAPEPTNIIWENRDRTYKQQCTRKLIVILIVFILLCLAFAAFYFLKRITINNYKKYPPTTDCDNILDQFGNVLTGTFREYAELDEKPTDIFQGTGIYQCYCAEYKKVNGNYDDAPFCSTYSSD